MIDKFVVFLILLCKKIIIIIKKNCFMVISLWDPLFSTGNCFLHSLNCFFTYCFWNGHFGSNGKCTKQFRKCKKKKKNTHFLTCYLLNWYILCAHARGRRKLLSAPPFSLPTLPKRLSIVFHKYLFLFKFFL